MGSYKLNNGDLSVLSASIQNEGSLSLYEATLSGTGAISVKAPTAVPVPYTITLPTDPPLTDAVLQYDGADYIWAVGVVGGVQSINGLSASIQYLANDFNGLTPNWDSTTDTHTLNIPMASTSLVTAGLISNAEWTDFDSKQDALVIGNLTEDISTVLTIVGGTGAIIGSGLTIQVHLADTATSGYLSSTDWNTFNNKQPAGTYISSLTGEVSATGPGSASATISNAAVIAKVLTGYTSGAGTISAADSILSAIQKLNGNDGLRVLKAGDTMTGNLTMNAQSEVRYADSDSSNYTAVRGAATIGTNYTITLPAAAPGTNTFLKFDGANYIWGSGDGTGDVNNGGNAYGSNMSIGTTDAFTLSFKTNNFTRLTLGTTDSTLVAPDSNTQNVDTGLKAGNAVSGNVDGGDLSLYSGNGTGTANGGTIDILGGAAAPASNAGHGGNINITAGLTTGNVSPGGVVTITGGDSNANAGSVLIYGGDSGGSGNGGAVWLEPGDSTSGTAGFINLKGRVSFASQLFNGSATINAKTWFVGVNPNGAPSTVTLPSSSILGTGTVFVIKDTSGTASTYNITVTAAGGNTIEGAGTYVISDDGGHVTLYQSASTWRVISSSSTSSGGDINNGGNAFGSDITIGTTDTFALSFLTDNVVRMSIPDDESALIVPDSNTLADFSLVAGSALSGDNNGGNLLVQAGVSSGTGNGGNTTVAAGDAGDGNGGTVFIQGGNGTANNSSGGPVRILAGTPFGVGNTAYVEVRASDSVDAIGGSVQIWGGASTNNGGGDITLTAGNGNGGGPISIIAGSGSAGIGGGILIQPGGGATFAGSIALIGRIQVAPQNISSDDSISDTAVYVGIDDTSSPRTVTLESITDMGQGILLFIKDESNGAGTNAITLTTSGGDTINDGVSTTYDIDTDGGAVILISNGTRWNVISTAGSSGSGDINDGGNSFGSDISIGTQDAFGLIFITDNTPRFRISDIMSNISVPDSDTLQDMSLSAGSALTGDIDGGAITLTAGDPSGTANGGNINLATGDTTSGLRGQINFMAGPDVMAMMQLADIGIPNSNPPITVIRSRASYPASHIYLVGGDGLAAPGEFAFRTYQSGLITLTANAVGTAGNTLGMVVQNQGPSQPLTVVLNGGIQIEITPETDGGGVILSTIDDVVQAINLDPFVSPLVTATGSGLTLVVNESLLNLQNGLDPNPDIDGGNVCLAMGAGAGAGQIGIIDFRTPGGTVAAFRPNPDSSVTFSVESGSSQSPALAVGFFGLHNGGTNLNDDVPTSIFSQDTDPALVHMWEVRVVVQDSANEDSGVFFIRAMIKNRGTGLTITEISREEQKDNPLWDLQLQVSGTNAQIVATGSAASQTSWYVSVMRAG